jgi:HEAT repeat protein
MRTCPQPLLDLAGLRAGWVMGIRFCCPDCNKVQEAPFSKAGATTICPRCQAETIVPLFSELRPDEDESDLFFDGPRDRRHLRRTAVVVAALVALTFVGWAAWLTSLRNDGESRARAVAPNALVIPEGQPQPAGSPPHAEIPAAVAARDALANGPGVSHSAEAAKEEKIAAVPNKDATSALRSPRPPGEAMDQPIKQTETPPPTASDYAGFRRRQLLTETQLRAQLAVVPEVKSFTLPVVNTLVQSYYRAFKASGGELSPNTLLRIRGDLVNLPLVPANQWQSRNALTLQTLSRELRALLQLTAPTDAKGHRALPDTLETVMRSRQVRGKPEWLRPEAVPVLLQLLGHEDRPVRQMLVELLADIPGPAADTALAQRAVVDLAPDVRESALRALRDRPRGEARRVFLRYLRYPWTPIADHAAEALVYLRDQDAVPPMVALLRKPDPAGPLPGAKGKAYFQEVVRIPHDANCLICHPAALTNRDLVLRSIPGVVLHLTGDRATVFSANQLPPALQGASQQTVQSQPSGGSYSRSSGSKLGPLYVRADTTFFRQDFSLTELIADPSTGIQKPRSDFLLRTRPGREEDLAGQRSVYPQREAVLWALRLLTGKDPGSETDAWVALYPRAEFEADATALADELLKASGSRREKLLTRLREGEDAVNTEALVAAIPRLGPTSKAKARTALVERLTRLPDETLLENFRDKEPEIRRAAALACASKGSRERIRDLEPLLNDPESAVAAAARDALRQLAGEPKAK